MSDQLVAKTTIYTTQQTQETNIHALSGIQTSDRNNHAASDLRLKPHGHGNRPRLNNENEFRRYFIFSQRKFVFTWINLYKEINCCYRRLTKKFRSWHSGLRHRIVPQVDPEDGNIMFNGNKFIYLQTYETLLYIFIRSEQTCCETTYITKNINAKFTL
jgi:hypothetical protein